MIIAQVCLSLAKIKGHSKICSFITQHNATDVASFEGGVQCCKGSVHQSWKLKTSQFLHGQAYSPDMSPIDHGLDALDKHIRQRVLVPANILQLCTVIEEEWINITQATINNLTNSMWRRCVALHEANSGHITNGLFFGPPRPPDPPDPQTPQTPPIQYNCTF